MQTAQDILHSAPLPVTRKKSWKSPAAVSSFHFPSPISCRTAITVEENSWNRRHAENEMLYRF
jgi:hypothetical protein